MADVQTSSLKPAYAHVRETRHRFSHRTKRISRRAERDRFSFFVVPAVWMLGVLGFVGLGVAALHYLVAGEANWSLYLLPVVPLLSALMLVLFRAVRGHYNAALDEP